MRMVSARWLSSGREATGPPGLILSVHEVPFVCTPIPLGAAHVATASRKVRKNLRLTQAKLDRARRILGAGTETDTVEQALDLVVFRQEVIAGVRRLAGSRSWRDNLRDGAA